MGEISFTVGQDTTNQVATVSDKKVQTVPLSTLDAILMNENPTVIKMDVEGFETEPSVGAASVLTNPSLLAIQLETVDDAARKLLTDAGFIHFFYDPPKHKLLRFKRGGGGSNSLFIRQTKLVGDRLTQASGQYF